MKILYSPMLDETRKLEYTFEKETIKAKLIDGGKIFTDSFNLSSFLEKGIYDGVETSLPLKPWEHVIIDVKREDGVLSVILLNFITNDSQENEKFPEWQEV